MENCYTLEKWEWTESDFDIMSWHDCPIYAVRFEDNIYFDIDYIFKWNHNGDGNPFTFWIAPATLVFETPYYLKIDVELNFVNGLEIAEVLKRKNEDGTTRWNIETREGKIEIGSEKYTQIIRRTPSFQFEQAIPLDERGEISFSLKSEKNFLLDAEVTIRKESQYHLYEIAKEKRVLIQKKEKLYINPSDTKDFLLKKRQIEKRLLEIAEILKQTKFKNW